MNFLLVFIFIPAVLASLDHLSYRIKRQDPDDDLEGSGVGINSDPTRVDEEPDSPDEERGDPELDPLTSPGPQATTTENPALQEVKDLLTPKLTDTPEAPTGEPAIAEEAQAPTAEPPPVQESQPFTEVPAPLEESQLPTEPPAPVEDSQLSTEAPAPTEEPLSPSSPIENDVRDVEQPLPPPPIPSEFPLTGPPVPPQFSPPPPQSSPVGPPAPPQFAPAPPPVPHVPHRSGAGHIPTSYRPFADSSSTSTNSDFLVDETPKDGVPPCLVPPSDSDDPSSGQPERINKDALAIPRNDNLKNSTGTDSPNRTQAGDDAVERKVIGGGGLDPELLESSDLKRSKDSWSILPVDELSLLIFILLCLILIVILLVCCFILQHMTSWAIIKVDRSSKGRTSPTSKTYENVCPLKSEHDEGVAKYTIEPDEKEGVVQLVTFTKAPPQSTQTFTLEHNRRAELHRSTVEVILTGDPESQKRSSPVTIATIKENNLNLPQNQMPSGRPISDTWIRDVLKKIENEDAEEPEPAQTSFNEINNLVGKNSTLDPDRGGDVNKTFLQKFAVNSTVSSKKMVVETVEKPSTNSRLQVDKSGNQSGSRKSMDDLSGDDELDDYLDNTEFPV